MLPHVLFLGSGVVNDQIRANLQDLAAMSLIRPFAWVDPRATPGSASVRICHPDRAEGELTSVATLDAALRGISDPVLLVALDAMGHDPQSAFDLSAVQAWTDAVDSYLPGSNPRVRVLLPRLPLQELVPAPTMGWSTVAIAPEDSDTPDSSFTPIRRADDPVAVARLAASTLASITGLWSSAETCPLTDESGRAVSTGDAETFRLVRAYHRTIDASQVEAEIREQVFDLSEQLPLPIVEEGRQAVRIPDHAAVAGQCADGLVQKYQDSLIMPPQAEETEQTKKTNAWAAMKAFLGEFFRAAVGSPSDWKASQTHALNTAVAKAVQNTLYGQGTAVDVVCGTYRGRIHDRSMTGLSAATATLKENARSHGLAVEDPPSLPDLWNGYRRVALMLVDGTNYMGDQFNAPRDNQHNPAIMEQGWMSVPDPEQRFEGYHPQLADILGVTPEQATISPYDSHGAALYREGLDFAVTQTSDRKVLALRDRFAQWEQEMSQSFAWKTGQRITHLLQGAQQNAQYWRTRHQEISADLQKHQDRDYDKENRRLTRTLRFFTVLWFILMLVIGYLTLAHYQPKWRFAEWMTGIDWRWTVGSIFVATVITLGIQMFIFGRARRGILGDVTQMRLLTKNEEITRRNSDNALLDIDRLTRAYLQFLSWSTILGRAIAQPLGRNTSTQETVTIPQDGLPRSTQLGRATLSDDELHQIISDLRHRAFPRDWADQSLDTLMADAADVLHKRDGTRITSVSELHGSQGLNSHSPLDKVSRLIASGQLDHRDHTDERWSQAISGQGMAAHLDTRNATVEMYESGTLITVSRTEFLSRLVQSAASEGAQRFSSKSLNNEAVNARATEIDPLIGGLFETPGDTTSAGTLTRSVTVVQYGHFTHLSGVAVAPTHREQPTQKVAWSEPSADTTPPVTPSIHPGDDTPSGWNSLI